MKQLRVLFLLSVALFAPLSLLHAQGDRVFSIPLVDLESWSKDVVITLTDVTIHDHSGVHQLDDDCEMHFGASSTNFSGDPPGLVLEPMNICTESFEPGTEYSKAKWLEYANSLNDKVVTISGVPRIWPEHLVGKASDSNPHHAVEFHPLTSINDGTSSKNFSSMISCPETYMGGLSEEKAKAIIAEASVGVTASGENCEIDFDAATIGNFTTLTIRFQKSAVESLTSGHRIGGWVVWTKNSKTSMRFITVAGSPVDEAVKKFKTSTKKTMTFQALVLFSLNPKQLHAAGLKSISTGKRSVVSNPLQLIVYGESQ